MRITHFFDKTCLATTMLFCLAAATTAVASPSNQEKKEIVYHMYTDYKKDFPAVVDLYPQQVMQLMEKNAVIFVDTRKPAERQVSMLPGAISKEQFLQSPQTFRDKTVVGYCTISYRSGVFAREMAEKGVTVYNLAGGMLAWTLEGGKVYDANGIETKRIHVYSDKWDYAPDGYETVKFSLWQQLF